MRDLSPEDAVNPFDRPTLHKLLNSAKRCVVSFGLLNAPEGPTIRITKTEARRMIDEYDLHDDDIAVCQLLYGTFVITFAT